MGPLESSGGEKRPYEPLNRILVIYMHKEPYLYGTISKMGCDPRHLEWYSPFLISKANSKGEEEVYGTVGGILARVVAQLAK